MSDQVTETINRYLKSVRSHLGHLPEDERSAIIDNLDLQVRDALRTRCQAAAPTLDDVNAVLSEMDPPEAFAPERPEETVRRPRPFVGGMALFISLAGLLFSALLAILVINSGDHALALGLTFMTSQILALFVAILSRGDKRGKAAIVLALVSTVGLGALRVGLQKRFLVVSDARSLQTQIVEIDRRLTAITPEPELHNIPQIGVVQIAGGRYAVYYDKAWPRVFICGKTDRQVFFKVTHSSSDPLSMMGRKVGIARSRGTGVHARGGVPDSAGLLYWELSYQEEEPSEEPLRSLYLKRQRLQERLRRERGR